MKKLKYIVGAVALFAVASANVWNAATTLRGSELSIADVEAMADPPEWTIWHGFYTDLEYWFTGKNKMKWYEFASFTTSYGGRYEVNHGEVCDYSDDGTDADCKWNQTRWWSVTVG